MVPLLEENCQTGGDELIQSRAPQGQTIPEDVLYV